MPPLPPPESVPSDDERLRTLVGAIRDETVRAARVHATLVRLRSEALQIALDQVARSRSKNTREREMPIRSLALEVAVATRSHDLTVQRELSDAHTLTEKFPATVDALTDGRIGVRHAHAILETGIVLDDDATRAAWEQVVLTRAERDSPGRVRAFGRELAESVHPVGMTKRHERAATTRGVSVRDLADGMAELSVILPATVAYGIRDRLRRQAAAIREAGAAIADAESDAASPQSDPAAEHGTEHAAHAPQAASRAGKRDEAAGEHKATVTSGAAAHDAPDGPPRVLGQAAMSTSPEGLASSDGSGDRPADGRTLAQIAADVCADLLLTATPAIDPTSEATCPGGLGAIRGHVQVTIPVLTLLGQADTGASIDGVTPIDPATARHLAAERRAGTECCATR